MVNLSFSYLDLEYFLLILVRVSCFIYIAPFFSMNNTPAQIRIGLSVCTSILLYGSLTPADAVVYDTVMEYAVIVIKEAATGFLIGFSATLCTAIVNFTGTLVDMQTGLSMVTLMDPSSKEQTSITGVIYHNTLTLMLIVSGMYRYMLGALADSFLLIPVNGAVIRSENIISTMVTFLTDYIAIGFRISLPVFTVILVMNVVLGVLAKVSPQMNMFAVGMQIKIIAGLVTLYLTTNLLSGASSLIFNEIQNLTVSFVGGMM